MQPNAKVHLCFVVYEYLPHFSSAEEMLDDLFTLTDTTEALQQLGFQVSVVMRFNENVTLQRHGVHYHGISDKFGPRLKFWQMPRLVHDKVLALRPNIVHTHNMNKVLQHNHLANRLSGSIPLIVQNHAEWPAKRVRILLQRLVFRKVAAFLFCAKGQEEQWLAANTLRPSQVYFVMEGTTHFKPQDRRRSQQQTGLTGAPVFLWVGNLDHNKDPLSMLRAFDEVLRDYPAARLYMVYRFAPLQAVVQEFIDASPRLRQSVSLLGPRPRAALEVIYNSAHYFVLGSHREGSGYSLMEAMACGCVPVVSSIPSFRMMTDDGQIGALFPVGDVEAIILALRKVLGEPWLEHSQSARQQFEQQLSQGAIADRLSAIYLKLLAKRRS